MKLSTKYKLALPLCFVLYTGVVFAETQNATKMYADKLVVDKDNIKIWTFQSPNNPAFNYRATTTYNTNLSTVVAVIMDTSSLSSWVPYTRQVDVIERNDKTGDFILRMELDFPFPLSDRDVVVKGNISQQANGTVTINNKSIEDVRAPEKAGLVRIKKYEGKWILKPISKNQVEVSTAGFADPAGHLPLSIVNMFVQKQPFIMLQKMREQVKNIRYQNVNVAGVIEPSY